MENFHLFCSCHAGFLATGLVVTVTRPDVGDATGPIVTVTVASLQVGTVMHNAHNALATPKFGRGTDLIHYDPLYCIRVHVLNVSVEYIYITTKLRTRAGNINKICVQLINGGQLHYYFNFGTRNGLWVTLRINQQWCKSH